MDVQPVMLQGSAVRLEPLTMDHLPGLVRVGLDPELWRWIPTNVQNAEDMRVYVERALDEQHKGTSVPFAIVAEATGEVVGSTRYMNIDRPNRRLEIGCTWLTPEYQRGRSNTEAKLMLLTHAFEMLGAIRVELKTDALNHKSRTAIARIGAKEEGTFRKHLITDTGRIRDTVYFSIIDSEWPAVKARLVGLDGA
jgi:RimJ/RimL family protein N-acetyltransferase